MWHVSPRVCDAVISSMEDQRRGDEMFPHDFVDCSSARSDHASLLIHMVRKVTIGIHHQLQIIGEPPSSPILTETFRICRRHNQEHPGVECVPESRTFELDDPLHVSWEYLCSH